MESSINSLSGQSFEHFRRLQEAQEIRGTYFYFCDKHPNGID